MNAILEQINSAGLRFVEFALPMFVQSVVLIVILLLADFTLRKKVRAVFRYWIWLLVLVKLVLPTSLSSPLSLGYFFGDRLTYVDTTETPSEPQANLVEPAPVSVPPFIDLTDIETDKFTPAAPPIIPEAEPAVTSQATRSVISVTPLSWQGAVFLVWLTAVIAMTLLLLQRAIFVRGLVAQAKEANGVMADMIKSCRSSVSVKRKLGLKISANAASPAVCGLFRPVILVPQNLASSLTANQLRAVLLHELAHIRRGDLFVNLAQTVLQIIYFYNPLLWLANCIIRRIREQAVDEMVLVAMGEKAPQYPQTLVSVAKLAFKRPVLSLRLIGVVESKSALSGRIKHILNRPLPKKAKLGILGMVVVIIIGAILLPMASSMPGPPELVIKGIVKDAQTNEPIAGARVFDDKYGNEPVWEQIRPDQRSQWGAITNSAGRYSFLTWPEHHTIKVEALGYKSERQSLYDGHFTFNKKDVEIFDFALEPEFKPPEMSLKAKPTYATDEPIELYFSWADNGWVQTIDNRAPENKDKWNLILRVNGADYGQGEFPILVPRYITAGVVRQGRHFDAREAYSKGKRIEFPPGRYRVSYVFKDVSAARPDEPRKVVHFGDIATNEVEFDVVEGDAVSSSGFAAKLAKGVKVELIGICEHPSEGKQWWRPDGSFLQEKPYGTIKGDKIFFGANEKAYEFVVRLEGPADVRVNWQAVPEGGLRMTSFPYDVDGKLLPDTRVLITRFNKTVRMAQIHIGIAPKVPDKNVVQDDGWVDFRNVSLRPGVKTDVQINSTELQSPSFIHRDLSNPPIPRLCDLDQSFIKGIRQLGFHAKHPRTLWQISSSDKKYNPKWYFRVNGKDYPLHVTGQFASARRELTEGFCFPYLMDRQKKWPDGDYKLSVVVKNVVWLNPEKRRRYYKELSTEPIEFKIKDGDYFSKTGQRLPESGPEKKNASPQPGMKTDVQVELKGVSNQLSGRVVDETGEPIADAQVAISTEKIGVKISNGKLFPMRRSDIDSKIIQTDSQGRFNFGQKPSDIFNLIVAHEKGFAQVGSEDITASYEIRIQPWGKIKGQLARGRKAAGDKITLSSLPNSTWFVRRSECRHETKCDTAGYFVFDKVSPGWFEVGYLVSVGEASASITCRTPVEVEAGRAVEIILGGSGRPVIGQFVPPPGYDMPIYFGNGLRALDTVRPERPRPDNYNQMTKRQQQQWYKQWRKTDEYKKYRDAVWLDKNRRHYTFKINKDGSFRIEDVIAGEYKLTVWIEERLTGQGRPEEIAGYYGTIEVSEIPGGRSDEPLDLGELELTMHNPLRVGDIAPLFEAKTLNGENLRLIDYRGKFVLLSFWQPVSHPELHQLRELYDTYNDKGRLEIIGLGGNDTLDEVKNYVRESTIPWPQIYTGEEFKSGIAKDYNGFGIFLIGPDGKIVAKDLRGEKLMSTVNETLNDANKNKSHAQVKG